ncbi:MAG: dihydrofolate reductase [Verrucomicrobiales bacterium]|nr:dihydrofolate reductase [Verrucomicrobiales bacterium]
MKPEVTMIAAMTENGVIGSENGGIPWSLPRDKEHFRTRTRKRWLLVGRTTYLEMSGWFEDRTPIVLTHNRKFQPEAKGHRVVNSVPEAIALAEANGARELVVCGGSAVYHAALPFADRLIVTKISFDGEVIAPVLFPEFHSNKKWRLTERERWNSDANNAFKAELLTFQKRPNNGDENPQIS